MHPRPVPEWQLTKVQLGQALSPLGKAIGPGIVEHAKQAGLPLPADIANAKGPPTDEQLVEVIFVIAAHYFPRLAEACGIHRSPGLDAVSRDGVLGALSRRRCRTRGTGGSGSSGQRPTRMRPPPP